MVHIWNKRELGFRPTRLGERICTHTSYHVLWKCEGNILYEGEGFIVESSLDPGRGRFLLQTYTVIQLCVQVLF